MAEIPVTDEILNGGIWGDDLDAFEGTMISVFTNPMFVPMLNAEDRKTIISFFVARMKEEPKLEGFVRKLLESFNLEKHPFSQFKRSMLGGTISKALIQGVAAAADGNTDVEYTVKNYEFIEMLLSLSLFDKPQVGVLREKVAAAKAALEVTSDE